MKKTIAIILSLLTIIVFTGCGSDRRINNSSTATVSFDEVNLDSSANTSTQNSSAVTTSEKTLNINKGNGQVGSVGYKTDDDGKLISSFRVTSGIIPFDGTKSYDHTPSRGSYGPKETNSEKSSSFRPVESRENEKDTIMVSISIECSTAVKRGNKVAISISDANGVIKLPTSIPINKNASVWSLLSLAQVVVDSSASPLGRYVISINSLAERDEGGGSGWMYFVNGKMSNTACDKQTLSDGDQVVWRYTCVQGDLT